MSFRINGNPITTIKGFQNHFDIQEIMRTLNLFISECDCIFNHSDYSDWFSLLGNVYAEDNPYSILIIQKDICKLRYDSKDYDLIIGFDINDIAEQNIVLNKVQLIKVILYQLGKRHLPTKLLNGNAKTIDGDEIEVSNIAGGENSFPFRLFDYCDLLPDKIRTIKILNTSQGDNKSITLAVTNEEDETIDLLRLREGEYIYANFVGNRFVEFLPRISVSLTQTAYHSFDGHIVSFSTDKHYPNTDDVTQFCINDEEGLLTLKKGVISPRNIHNNLDGIKQNLEKDECIVKIMMRHDVIAALTNKGNVLQNIAPYVIRKKNDVVSIGFGWDSGLYMIKSNGNLIFASNQEIVVLESVYNVLSADFNSFSVLTRDGANQLPHDVSEKVGLFRRFNCNRKAFKWNLKTLELTAEGCADSIATDIEEITLRGIYNIGNALTYEIVCLSNGNILFIE